MEIQCWHWKRLDAFEFKCYRKLLGITFCKRRTNDCVVMEIERLISLVNVAKRRNLKWYGHITHYHDQYLLTHTIVYGTVPACRGRGQPRQSWADDIAIWTGRSRVEATRSAQDRKGWQSVIVAASTDHLSRLWGWRCWGQAMVTYTIPKQRKKEESERLGGERDQIKFIDVGFERWQAVRYRKARRKQDVLQVACSRDEWWFVGQSLWIRKWKLVMGVSELSFLWSWHASEEQQ